MDSLDRLDKLLEGTNFMAFPDLKSPDPMKDLEAHNNKECEKLGEEKMDRFWGLVWAIAADKLQPLALEKYGNTSDSAVRNVLQELLTENMRTLESNSDWQHLIQNIKDHLMNEEQMAPDQVEQFISFCLIDYHVDFYAEGVRRWEFLPRAFSNETVDILAKMFQEVICVND